MIILSQVPYLPGDVQDANHIRVENHHSVGLTWSTVKIEALDGTMSTRHVRCVSSPDRPRFPGSVVVHLKPAPKEPRTTLHCRDIPTPGLLRYVNTNSHWPTFDEYLILIASKSIVPVAVSQPLKKGCNLITRKERTLRRKQLVAVLGNTTVLTDKGRRLLAGYVNAGF
jgi:hypothetical protein